MPTEEITESVVRDRFKITVNCCDSCHDDWDELGYGMCCIALSEDSYAHVCCAVARELRKKIAIGSLV
jgi:hypothetical protein